MIEAYGKNVLVKAVFPVTEKKIITLQDEKPTHYEVISVGYLVDHMRVGEKLIMKSFGLHPFEHDGEKYYLAEIEAIVAKIS